MNCTKHFFKIALCLIFLTSPEWGFAQLFFDATLKLPPAVTSFQSVNIKSVDIDRDGDMDIILANEFQKNTLLLNDGWANFSALPGAIPDNVHDSEDIALADFNRDGHIDIIFVSEDDFEHEYYYNNGQSIFTFAAFLPFTACNAVGSADFNKDGAPDLFLGNRGQNMLMINQGDGELVNETPFRLPDLYDLTHDVKLIDVEGDGDVDILIGNEELNKLLINDGNGYFTDETASRLPQGLPIDTRKVVSADVDGDNDLDLFLATVEFSFGKDPQNRLWINDGNGHFTDVTLAQLPLVPDQAIDGSFLDLDGDDDLDLIVSGVLNQPVKFYINDGKGYFTNKTAEVTGNGQIFSEPIDAFAISVADFNQDGFKDLYVCNRAGQDRLYLRDPNATLDGTTPTVNLPDVGWVDVYPNPMQNMIYIKWGELPKEKVNYTLLDIDGRLIQEYKQSDKKTRLIEMELPIQLSAGLYLLQMDVGNQRHTFRLVKDH